jgi:23S rRNA pseudouridine1911/1915/1917 synthase
MASSEIAFVVEQGGERLDRHLVGCLDGVSRALVQRWIREGQVLVNGQTAKASARLSSGDVLHVRVPKEVPRTLTPWDYPLTVVYEDADCVVLDKPAGLVVHPATTWQQDTLVHALLARYPELGRMADPDTEAGQRPGIVHRLDRDTSGLMVVARHKAAQAMLQGQFQQRSVEKAYLTLVHGRLNPPQGTIEAPIGRDPRNRQRMAVVPEGREAQTRYRTEQFLHAPFGTREPYTLAEAWPKTGRTHQIRVHLAYVGHPVVGDLLYAGRRKQVACPRQFLHAYRLGFRRPGDGEWVRSESPLPPDLTQVLSLLAAVE